MAQKTCQTLRVNNILVVAGGRSVVSNMPSKGELPQPVRGVIHDLVNKLSTIVGNCDLLNEMTEQGTEYAKRLAIIRHAAVSAAKDLTEHQGQLAREIRRVDEQKRLIS